jgi:hypothetical protein
MYKVLGLNSRREKEKERRREQGRGAERKNSNLTSRGSWQVPCLSKW